MKKIGIATILKKKTNVFEKNGTKMVALNDFYDWDSNSSKTYMNAGKKMLPNSDRCCMIPK